MNTTTTARAKELVAQFEAERKMREKRDQTVADNAERARIELEEIEENKIKYPERLGLGLSTQIMLERIEMSNEEYENTYVFNYNPYDGAHALNNVLVAMDGHVRQIATPGMGFLAPDQPPQRLSITVDAQGTTIGIPWGAISIARWEYGQITTGGTVDDGALKFVVTVKAKRKWLPEIEVVMQALRDELETNSIYKGKALELRYSEKDGTPKKVAIPTFVNIRNEEVFYNDDIGPVIESHLFTPFVDMAKTEKLGIPIKRGIILAGEYGNGKTLTGYKMARMATARGWTFIACEAEDYERVISFARQYTPAIIFAEDLNKVTERQPDDKRSAAVNRLTTVMDGISSKTDKIMSVFTTNRPQDIDRAFRRTGRAGEYFELTSPVGNASVRLLRHYAVDSDGENMLDPNLTDAEILEILQPVIKLEVPASEYKAIADECKFPNLAAWIASKSDKKPLVDAAQLRVSINTLIPKLEYQMDLRKMGKDKNNGASPVHTLMDDMFSLPTRLDELHKLIKSAV